MSEFKRIIEKYIDVDYEELVIKAKQMVEVFFPLYKTIDEGQSGMTLMSATVRAASSVDGVFSLKERKFIKDVLDVEEEMVNKICQFCKGSEYDLVDIIADVVTREEKNAIVEFIALLSACDGIASVEESKFLKKIIE